MNKRFFLILIVFCCVLVFSLAKANTWKDYLWTWDVFSWKVDNFSWVSTQSWEVDKVVDKAKYLKHFLDKEKEMINEIYKNSSFWVFLDVENAQEQLEALSGKFKDLSTDFDKVKSKKQKVDKRYQDLRKSIKNIFEDIRKNNSKITDKIIKIKIYTKKLLELKSNLKKIEKDIDSTKSSLERYTKFLYKLNNDYYWKNFEIDNVKLFIKSKNIADTLSEEEIIKILTMKLKDLINNLKKKRKKYNKYTDKLDELRVEYKYEVKEFKNEVENLQEQKEYLVKLLNFINEDKQELTNKYKKLVNNKSDVRKKILNMVSLTQHKMDKVDFSSWLDINPLLDSKWKKDWDKFFSWPVLPVKKISSFYKDSEYQKHFGVEHRGLDVAVKQGSEIYAPANGVVYKVVNNDSLRVNRMVVLHKHWYITVYMHLNDIFVKKWDFIKRWEIIAKSWGKPWTRWAWLVSDGPHLHFEVIQNGKHMDPLHVLDLSVLNGKNQLIEKYHFKYIKDKYSRKFDLWDIDYISWNSLAEKRKNFLKKFAYGPYRKLELWKKAAKNTNVDLDIWICIGFAESGLWHNMSSEWNVGNVWNNDRGDRVWFSSAYEWARVIYMALINKYLSQHNTIDNLSRYGNKKWSIYASDKVHWQKNVNKCLSMIKWYQVPENYTFRVFENRNNFEK